MRISIPNPSLVVFVGPSGSGKSSFARKHFLPAEVLSSGFCRGLVADDEDEQGATNVQPEARKPLVTLAREFHCLPVAVVLNLPEKLRHERNASRPPGAEGPRTGVPPDHLRPGVHAALEPRTRVHGRTLTI